MNPKSFYKLGILGHPLGHTLSPVLHQHLLGAAGLNGSYVAYDTPPAQLAMQLDALQAAGIVGLNVTIPHKVAVIPLLDQLSPAAQVMQSVNTLVFEPQPDGSVKRIGHNTDVSGFMKSLPDAAHQQLKKTHALILGAGGSARAVLAGLIEACVPEITLAVRNPDKAQDTLAVAQRIGATYQSPTNICLVDIAQLASLSEYQLLVNTTPVGMSPHGDAMPISGALLDSLPSNATVVDLIYRPLATQLIQHATTRGLSACGGLGMLVHQGVDAFALWTGWQASIKVATATCSHLEKALP